MSDLGSDVLMLTELANEVASDVETVAYGFLTDDTREQYLIAWAALEDAYKVLAGAKADLGERLAESMPDKQMTIDNVGTFEVHRKNNRTQWEKDDLLRAVLDTVRVDKETGEILPETPLDKVLTVFNLPAPRTTALRQRGLDADEFCHVEQGGLTLQLIR